MLQPTNMNIANWHSDELAWLKQWNRVVLSMSTSVTIHGITSQSNRPLLGYAFASHRTTLLPAACCALPFIPIRLDWILILFQFFLFHSSSRIFSPVWSYLVKNIMLRVLSVFCPKEFFFSLSTFCLNFHEKITKWFTR